MNPISHHRFLAWLSSALLLVLIGGLLIGSESMRLDWSALMAWWSAPTPSDPLMMVVMEIRLPRTLGAILVGALLGLAGALAQGLFRNALADPYLLGSAAGAQLGVVFALVGGAAGGTVGLGALLQLSLVSAAFIGAWLSVLLTLFLARGAQHPIKLLLTGVVVGVVMNAATDALIMLEPSALRGKQSFMLGSTALLGWSACGVLALGLAVLLPMAWRWGRVLDALSLGDETAHSLGVRLSTWRLALVSLLALATALSVAQAGLIAFVGLVAPHVVRRCAPAPAAFTLLASSLTGAVLLSCADLFARGLLAPQELPVGLVTAIIGGLYLLRLLQKNGQVV